MLRFDGTLLRSDRFPVPHAFTTRLGGVSTGPYASLNLGHRKGDPAENIVKNREIAARLAGSPPIVALKQKVGDGVVTSGLGGIFPKGLVVGYVRSVRREQFGLFQTIEVESAVDFAHLEEVLVLLKETP